MSVVLGDLLFLHWEAYICDAKNASLMHLLIQLKIKVISFILTRKKNFLCIGTFSRYQVLIFPVQ